MINTAFGLKKLWFAIIPAVAFITVSNSHLSAQSAKGDIQNGTKSTYKNDLASLKTGFNKIKFGASVGWRNLGNTVVSLC